MPSTAQNPHFDIMSPLLDVLWADGRMSFHQVRALDLVAERFGVEDLARRISTVTPGDDVSGAPPGPLRAVAYALAVWVAAIDGRMDPRERSLLEHFASAWDLNDDVERRVRRLALNMARLASGRPTTAQLEALLRGAGQLLEPAEPVDDAA